VDILDLFFSCSSDVSRASNGDGVLFSTLVVDPRRGPQVAVTDADRRYLRLQSPANEDPA
jgi:hypothetical protein